MNKIKWRESTQHRKFRWENYGKADFRKRILFYGIFTPVAALIAAYLYDGILGLALMVPFLLIMGLDSIFQWFFGNYSRRRIALNEKRIWAGGLFAPWSCALKHIEHARIKPWTASDSSGIQLFLQTYSGEIKEIDLPRGQLLTDIENLLNDRLEPFASEQRREIRRARA